MTATATTPAGPTTPAGEPRPGPLTPPEQPQRPSEPQAPPEPMPEPGRSLMTAAGLIDDRSPDDEVRDDYPLSVHEAIAEVTRRVGAVAKTGRADARAGGYRFRGIDDVLLALHPILGDVGLVLLPGEVVEAVWETRATSGSNLNVARLRVRYTMVGPDGSWLPGEAWGEGGDTGDKATQKAMSQAYKSFALQAFSIPTQASADDDPDASNPPSRPFTDTERQRAAAAYIAARDADTYDRLAAIRQGAMAEGLLDVPVAQAQGDVPLTVLLDQRRAEVDRATRPAQ